MPHQVEQLALLAFFVAALRELIVSPCVRWLHRRGILRGPYNKPFLSWGVRWRNIGIFLAFNVLWVSLIVGILHLV